MLTASHLAFRYRRQSILRDVSFAVAPGQVLVIAGPNGSGKSTLLSILSGALKPESGTIRTDGERIGLVPQGNAVFDDMTVRENLAFFSRLSGTALTRPLSMGLEPYADKLAGQLSGGYKKRLAIACTQMSSPEIWLFDEPCTSLDIVWRDEMIQTIHALKAHGCAIIYVGHDPAEFLSFYDAILFLEDGTGTLYQRGEIPEGTELTLFREKIRETAQ